jgi:hypothetical protein
MAPRYMTSRKMETSEYNTAFIPEVSSLHLVQPCTVTRLKQHNKVCQCYMCTITLKVEGRIFYNIIILFEI